MRKSGSKRFIDEVLHHPNSWSEKKYLIYGSFMVMYGLAESKVMVDDI